MLKINTHFFKQYWQIVKSYWLTQESSARKWLFLLIGLSIFSSSCLVVETLQRGEIISALAVRDGDRFWQTIRLLSLIIILSVPLVSWKKYFESRLALDWRKWLTERLLAKYFSDRKFYYLNTDSELDNPDRTIAEDINNFSQQSLFLFTQTLDSLIQLITFVVIIWFIYKPLVLFLLAYSILGTGLLFFIFGRILTIINLEQFKKEADFRFSLIRVRDNAETIAFYRGETLEKQQIKQRLLAVIKNFNRLIRWQFGLDLFQNGFQFFTMLIPALILAPSIFADNIEVGAITQSQIAFERIWLSLSLVIFQFDKITNLAAGVQRLDSLTNYLNSQHDSSLETKSLIHINEKDYLAIENLSLQTPDSQTQLIRELSLQIEPSQRLLIMGNSGVGKSSLIRAIASLWRTGTGSIIKPQSADILFLPQRPYLILGSLQSQLIYPHITNLVNQEQLEEIMEKVNLTKVLKKFGGLSAEKDWSQVLSRGEQQRLAFARLLLQQPKYAFL
ncbi:MAG: ATP-binding cassette domain-containing protein, partial [Cyanobacteria bacterium P01_F01_bin.143]